VQLLREHFQTFNVDASEICQWLMGIRPGNKREIEGTEPFWDFIIEPSDTLTDVDEDEIDKHRRRVFDVVIGIQPDESPSPPPPDSLLESMRLVATIPKTPTAERLFQRLGKYEPSHRQILIKAAAEWIVTRYQNGVKNWEPRHKEWEKEREVPHKNLCTIGGSGRSPRT
jgi:hypothetical protein